MHDTFTTTPVSVSRSTIALLNSILAKLADLHIRTKKVLKRLRQPPLPALKQSLNDFLSTVQLHIDFVAERKAALGGPVKGAGCGTGSQGRDWDSDEGRVDCAEPDSIRELTRIHGLCSGQIQRAIRMAAALDDFITAYLLTGTLRDLDQQLLKLQSHLD